jgi:hypothetical protein
MVQTIALQLVSGISLSQSPVLSLELDYLVHSTSKNGEYTNSIDLYLYPQAWDLHRPARPKWTLNPIMI